MFGTTLVPLKFAWTQRVVDHRAKEDALCTGPKQSDADWCVLHMLGGVKPSGAPDAVVQHVHQATARATKVQNRRSKTVAEASTPNQSAL